MMRYTVLLALLVGLFMGCGKQQTLAQREATPYKPKSEFLAQYPSFDIQQKIAEGGRELKTDAKGEVKNYSTTMLPIAGVMRGVTSLSGIAELGGLGLLSSSLAWLSSENVLARAKIDDIDSFFRPDLTFLSLEDGDYKSSFNKALELKEELTKGYDCKVEGILSDGNSAYAAAYQVEGEYWFRRYFCMGETKNKSLRVYVYSETTENGSKAILRIRRWLIADLKEDVNAQADEYTFKLYREMEAASAGWGVFYRGHEETLDWAWKSYLRINLKPIS